MKLKRAASFLALLSLATEAGIRLGGLVDVPTYRVNDTIGYIAAPSQSGDFLDKNTWVFNERSMGIAAHWDASKRPNLLLIGNSIVVGGNHNDQSTKLGPLLQKEVSERWSVWPIAMGGWTNINETAYLESNPDVTAAANVFVWEYMRGGLSRLAPWGGEYVFPQHRPLCATCYVFRRYAVPID